MADDYLNRIRQPHPVFNRYAAPKARTLKAIHQEIALYQAAEAIGPRETTKEKKPMASNTGAKGFSAILKVRSAQIREHLSKAADDLNTTMDEMQAEADKAHAHVAEVKADLAELKAALAGETNGE